MFKKLFLVTVIVFIFIFYGMIRNNIVLSSSCAVDYVKGELAMFMSKAPASSSKSDTTFNNYANMQFNKCRRTLVKLESRRSERNTKWVWDKKNAAVFTRFPNDNEIVIPCSDDVVILATNNENVVSRANVIGIDIYTNDGDYNIYEMNERKDIMLEGKAYSLDSFYFDTDNAVKLYNEHCNIGF